jgi:hypothetical protein
MVNEAREYREKVLTELSRRRDAARGQIEQLLHGRDRLLSAFERARLASEDVINGLADAHDEPEFIVNLAPVTGPVPVINPDHPSHGVFDREAEDIADEGEETANEIVNEISEVQDAVAVDLQYSTQTDEIQESVEIATPITDLTVDVAVQEVFEAEITEIVEEIIEETVEETVVHVVNDNISDTAVDEDDSMANVVSLFSRERIAPVLPEVLPEVMPEAKPAADDITENTVEDEVRVDTEKVNDIFARLRADSTTAVAKAVQKKTVSVDPKIFATRDESLAPLVVQFSRKLKRVLADEQNNVLEYLRKKRSVLEIESMLGSIDEHAGRYNEAVSDESMKAATEGTKSVKAAGGSSRRVTKKNVESVVLKAIADSIVASFREDARIAIGEAEGDRDILAGLMRDVYRQWKMSSLDEHVDDIACAAFSCGAYFSLEPGAKVMWMVNPDQGCCADCADNSLAEAVSVGENFPTGHQYPLAHVGCRCLVCPITH